RPSDVLYDCAGSAYALAGPGLYDWPALLDGAAWLHVTGIAPAGGDGPAQAALAALRTARAAGARIAFDGTAQPPLPEAMRMADRIGTGAAFAAGVLHGLQAGMAPADVAGFALAAAAMKHAIAGDFDVAHTGACA